jgi:hypothetical protein
MLVAAWRFLRRSSFRTDWSVSDRWTPRTTAFAKDLAPTRDRLPRTDTSDATSGVDRIGTPQTVKAGLIAVIALVVGTVFGFVQGLSGLIGVVVRAFTDVMLAPSPLILMRSQPGSPGVGRGMALIIAAPAWPAPRTWRAGADAHERAFVSATLQRRQSGPKSSLGVMPNMRRIRRSFVQAVSVGTLFIGLSRASDLTSTRRHDHLTGRSNSAVIRGLRWWFLPWGGGSCSAVVHRFI